MDLGDEQYVCKLDALHRKDEQFKERLRQRHEAERGLYERLAR